ncbi:MAG: tyrosine-type recombinase/integrase [Tyzzerella sp.]|nr:tyrosine-type recombinase/integrase [Tyzzerella sp.]
MPRAEKRFSLSCTDDAGHTTCLILDNGEREPVLSNWVSCKSIRKISTGKEYGSRLVFYLNYINSIGIEYPDADNEVVKKFINYVIYGGRDSANTVSMIPLVTYNTLSGYITAVTEFYKWLDNNYSSNMNFLQRTDTIHVKKSFLYGQIYSQDYKYLIDRYIPTLKERKEYIKWYSKEEKEQLCSHFKSLRDEAVFRITLEGFRIDEVLSMELECYDALKGLIQPMRSKGKHNAFSANNNGLRVVALPEKTCRVINEYIQKERNQAEMESGIISQKLFINVKKGNDFGMPLAYRNYLKILKRCAKRAGLDPSKIRTHSGRSTKVMEYVEHQIKHPEDGITDAILMECFGWKSIESIQPYKNHNNPAIAIEIMKKLHSKEEDNG